MFPFFLIPMAMQAIGAGIEGGKAKKQNALADKLDKQIPLNDPVQQGYLNRLAQQERYYRSGADPNTGLANRLVQQSGAQTQSNLVRAGGPGTVQNLLSSQNVTNRGLAANAAQAAGMADNMLGMQGNLVNLMAQRRYDRMRYGRDKALMQGQQYQQNSNNFVSSILGTPGTVAGGMAESGATAGTKATTPTTPTAGVPLRSAQNTSFPQNNFIQPLMASQTAPMPYADPSNLTMQLLNPR